MGIPSGVQAAANAASAVDVVALVLSGLALAVSIVGTVLSNRRAKSSEAIAREAFEDSRKASTQVLWSDAIEAVQRVMVDPMTEPMTEIFQTLRVRITALIDGLTDWDEFDRWLAIEHTLGASLAREVLERSRRRPETVDEHLNTLKPYMDWGVALGQNLRHFRNVGYSQEAVEQLRDHALKVLRSVYTRNGWGALPSKLEVPKS